MVVVRSAAVEAEDEQGEKEEPDVAGDSEVAVEVQVVTVTTAVTQTVSGTTTCTLVGEEG